MDALLPILQDWRFAATVAFVGAWLGHAIFLHTPPPSSAAVHFRKMMQAGNANAVARRLGPKAAPVALLTSMAGAQSAAALSHALRGQRRRHLLLGLALAAAAAIPVFLGVPAIQAVPDWLYGVVALLGGFRLWKSW
ncbi:MAG: hypothetical protein AAGC60_00780 [Acidobacteriota bacterium]